MIENKHIIKDDQYKILLLIFVFAFWFDYIIYNDSNFCRRILAFIC